MTMVAVTNTFGATGNGDTMTPTCSNQSPAEPFNIAVSGTFVGTVVLEKSFDNGATYIPVIRPATATAISYTAPGCEVLYEPETAVRYRWRCSAWTSGSIVTRISN